MFAWWAAWTASVAWSDEPLPTCSFPDDEDAVYVLTVQPLDDVIRLFGHTALLFWEPKRGKRSAVYDYGRFRLEGSPLDIVRDYLTMQQVYFLGGNPLSRSQARYGGQERGVIAQRLDLSAEEARALELSIIEQLAEPEFRYNWYDQNCSTKVRDRIDEAVGGALRAAMSEPSGTSPAAEVLRHSANHPLWLGLEWGSTRFARSEITDWDAMFLPEPMMHRLEAARRADGRPLVAETCQWLPAGQPPIPVAPPRRAGGLTLVGLGLAGVLGGLRRSSALAGAMGFGTFAFVLALWGTAALIVGLAGTFAPFWGNDNQAFASPLWALGGLAAFGAFRNPEARWPGVIVVGLLGVAGLGFVGSLAFGFAAGNLGLAGLLLPPMAVFAWFVSAPWRLEAASRSSAGR
ncbi:MAG: DUF4105 domain-containing protein [Myxococcota bacterium]